MAQKNEKQNIDNLILINYRLLETRVNDRELICRRITEYRTSNPSTVIGIYSLEHELGPLRMLINKYFTNEQTDCYGVGDSPFLIIPKTLNVLVLRNQPNFVKYGKTSYVTQDLNNRKIKSQVGKLFEKEIEEEKITILNNKGKFDDLFKTRPIVNPFAPFVEEPADEPVEEPAEEPADEPVEVPTGEPVEESPEEPQVERIPDNVSVSSVNINTSQCKALLPAHTDYFAQDENTEFFNIIVQKDPTHNPEKYKNWELVTQNKIMARSVLSNGYYHYRFKREDYSTTDMFYELVKKVCSKYNNTKPKQGSKQNNRNTTAKKSSNRSRGNTRRKTNKKRR